MLERAQKNEKIREKVVSGEMNFYDVADYLKKKSNYVLCMDDIADSFWNLKTCMKDLNG